MRVLLLGSFYEPEPTGVAVYNAAYARYLASRGDAVSVVTSMPNYPYGRIYEGYRGRLWRRETSDGVTIHRKWMYASVAQSTLRRALSELSFLVGGITAVTLPRPDVVIGVVPALSAGILSQLAAKRYGVPYGLMFKDLLAPGAEQSGVPGGGKVAAALRRVEGGISRKAQAVAIIGEGYRGYFDSLGVPADSVKMVRDWTHIDEPTLPREAVRKRLGIADDAFVCLHAGNMGYKQGLQHVVDCAKLAEARGASIEFIFVGAGNQRANLENLAASYNLGNVRFLDFQPHEIFPSMLASSDVLLVNQLASVIEMSLPSKITSYLASGIPMVAAVAPESEAARAVESSGGGVVVTPENPEKLLAALLELRRDPDLRSALGRDGREYARNELSAEASLRVFGEFVDFVVASARNGGRERPRRRFVHRP